MALIHEARGYVLVARGVMWEKHDDEPNNQLWYDDFETCTIRSKMNDLCLTVKGKLSSVSPSNVNHVLSHRQR